MIANGKIRITVTADEQRNGVLQGSVFIADVLVRSIEQTNYSLLEIRLIMPSQRADDLLFDMVLGKAEFSIAEIEPLLSTQQ